jgi:hypothetical protein
VSRDSIFRVQFWMVAGFIFVSLPMLGLSYLMSETVLYIPDGTWSLVDGFACGISGIVVGCMFGEWWDFER